MTGRSGGLPVGVRIAALTSVVLLALLGVAGMLAYQRFGLALRNEFDRRLVQRARTAIRIQGTAGVRGVILNEVGKPHGSESAEVEMQLLSANGAVVAATAGLSGVEGLVKGGSLVRVASGVPIYGDTTIDRTKYRFAGVPVGDDDGHILATAASIEDVSRAENALLEVSIPLIVVAGVAAIFGGVIIARLSLAPLREFVSQADAIGSLDLSQRLPTSRWADEVGRLGATLNSMLERLDTALRRERQLTAEVGHELRTPLAIIRAEAELLQELIADDGPSASLKSILEEVDRTTRAVDDILLLARADATAGLDRSELVNIGDLARTVVERFSALAAGQDVSLTSSGEGQVMGDPKLIERALTNLVDNALRHSPNGGTVEIEVGQHEVGAVLTVRDSGPGAPDSALETMFDRYTRAGPRTGAAGLGLSIVAAVARSHDGSVQARNRPKGGLEITVEFHGVTGEGGGHPYRL
jgi:signal transduction histidine kinase